MAISTALLGGVIIGLSAALMHVLLGRIAGISGIVGTLVVGRLSGEDRWRLAFVVGLIAGGSLWFLIDENHFSAVPGSNLRVIIAGLLVGFGSRLGGGCTSGHGVCGIGRMSLRSVVATFCFVFTGVVTVALL